MHRRGSRAPLLEPTLLALMEKVPLDYYDDVRGQTKRGRAVACEERDVDRYRWDAGAPRWLRAHLRELCERYGVEI